MQLIVHHVKDQLKKVRGQRLEGRGQRYRIHLKCVKNPTAVMSSFSFLPPLSVASTLGEDGLASFPGPAQFSIIISTTNDEKLGGAWERG